MSYRSTPAFAIGGVTPEFRCLICGVDVDTHHMREPRGICEAHCEDHEYEYDRYAGESFCLHCSAAAPDDYYYSDDDVGFSFSSGYTPAEPIGTPVSAMNGNAAERHNNPAAWDNWVAFCRRCGRD